MIGLNIEILSLSRVDEIRCTPCEFLNNRGNFSCGPERNVDQGVGVPGRVVHTRLTVEPHGTTQREGRAEAFAETLQTLGLEVALCLDLHRNNTLSSLQQKINLRLRLRRFPIKKLRLTGGKQLLHHILLRQSPFVLPKNAVSLDEYTPRQTALRGQQSHIGRVKFEGVPQETAKRHLRGTHA